MDGFGERLRARAQDLGLSDAEVARRAGLSVNRYGNYVRNTREPDLATLVRIAEVLGTTPDGLLQVGQGQAREATGARAALTAHAHPLNDKGLAIATALVSSLTAFDDLTDH